MIYHGRCRQAEVRSTVGGGYSWMTGGVRAHMQFVDDAFLHGVSRRAPAGARPGVTTDSGTWPSESTVDGSPKGSSVYDRRAR